MIKEQIDLLKKWIMEREAIRLKREAGKPAPWTQDVVLRNYRFCNVHREHDKVTRWIAENWREPYAAVSDLWFWMLIARLLNLPAALAVLKPPSARWKPEDFVAPLVKRRGAGENIFNAAYIVSTNGRAMDKVEYLATEVLAPAWAARAEVRPRPHDRLKDFCDRLTKLNGLAGFMAGQVVADMKYVGHLAVAEDWHTFAISGPGSRRGLNRICGYPVDARWNEKEWHETLVELGDVLRTKHGLREELHMQDLQNCLCEFDKWSRAVCGEGKPKQVYFHNQPKRNT